MPYSPYNLGNVLAQGEGVLNSRYARDPNSLPNQLRQAQLNALRHDAQNPGGGLSMAPISYKDATGDSIAAAIANDDPSLLVPRPYTPKSVDTKTHRIFYDIDPVTRDVTELHREPIQNFTSAYDTAAGGAAVAEGIPNPQVPVATDAQGGAFTGQGTESGLAPVYVPKSAAELAGAKTKEQEQAKVEVERESPTEVKKQQMREADAVNAKTLIDDMLAPRKDGNGIYATYAYGKENVMLGDIVKPQAWIDAEAKRNQLVSMMQLENVAKLKGTGPITEPEQKVLRQAMTVLENPLISPELVERELKRVRVMFARWEREAQAMQGKESAPDEKSNDGWTVEEL